MSRLHLRQAFQPSCPAESNWYACGSGSLFVGCCTSDPCANSCPDDNLRPASFNSKFYGSIPNEQCPPGSLWYTCAATNPPFLGCCKSSLCDDGCPAGNLTAGFLNLASATPFSPIPAITSAAAATAFSSAASTSSPLSSFVSASTSITSAVPTSVPNTVTQPTQHSISTGITVGSTLGGIAIVVIGLLLWYWKRYTLLSRRQSRQQMDSFSTDEQSQAIVADVKDVNGVVSLNSTFKKTIHQQPESFSFNSYGPSPGNKSKWMGTPGIEHFREPSYELLSPSVGSLHSHPQTPPPTYAEDLGISPAASGSPSLSAPQGNASSLIDSNSLNKLSSAESTRRRDQIA